MSQPDVTHHASVHLQWFALRVLSRRENAVRDALATLGIEVFHPVYSVESRWSDRTKRIDKPLFPGYVFARCPPCQIYRIFLIAGVVNVLPSNLSPSAIPEHEIEAVRRVLASQADVKPCEFEPGQAVEIRTGPFAGVSGIVKRSKGTARLIVAIGLLNRSVSVEIDASDATKAAAPTTRAA